MQSTTAVRSCGMKQDGHDATARLIIFIILRIVRRMHMADRVPVEIRETQHNPTNPSRIQPGKACGHIP